MSDGSNLLRKQNKMAAVIGLLVVMELTSGEGKKQFVMATRDRKWFKIKHQSYFHASIFRPEESHDFTSAVCLETGHIFR